jgi:hypothetical protein
MLGLATVGVACIAIATDATATSSLSAASLTTVGAAVPKTLGMAAPNVLSPELQQVVRAQGATAPAGGRRSSSGSRRTGTHGENFLYEVLPIHR